jgi:hypothetical protein
LSGSHFCPRFLKARPHRLKTLWTSPRFDDIALNKMREASPISFLDCRTALRAVTVAGVVAIACGLGGCAGNGSSGPFAAASAANAPTVAFESIDGPPRQIFERMVSVLDSEAKLRSLSIVSREAAASYRVRSYLSAQVNRGRTMIAWVWDVYDQNQLRALRLSGEEPAGKSGRDAWASADDMVLRKIAQAGLSGLSSMINGTQPQDVPPAVPSAPAKSGSAVATADQPSPASSALGAGALGYASQSSQ